MGNKLKLNKVRTERPWGTSSDKIPCLWNNQLLKRTRIETVGEDLVVNVIPIAVIGSPVSGFLLDHGDGNITVIIFILMWFWYFNWWMSHSGFGSFAIHRPIFWTPPWWRMGNRSKPNRHQRSSGWGSLWSGDESRNYRTGRYTIQMHVCGCEDAERFVHLMTCSLLYPICISRLLRWDYEAVHFGVTWTRKM